LRTGETDAETVEVLDENRRRPRSMRRLLDRRGAGRRRDDGRYDGCGRRLLPARGDERERQTDSQDSLHPLSLADVGRDEQE
jgi:hypothetical protein